MKLVSRHLAQRFFLATAASLLAACGGGGDSNPGASVAGAGTLRLALTDAPACGYDQVNVTVDKVRVHQSATAADSDNGWSEIVLTPAKRVNLLNLTNGVLEELGTTALPAGTYTQLRLVLSNNSAATPLANSVVPTSGAETALETPSAQQSGLKMNADIKVASNQVADFVLDFDACKSIVPAGQSGRYNLKPVVSILPRVASTGLAVEGYVVSALGVGSTSVSLQLAGAVARATVPDASGKFVLSPVAAGTYDLLITANGRVSSVVTGVPVTAISKTIVNPSSAPINPATSAMRSASGNVTTTGLPTIPDATVRALQAIGTPKVELIARPVDATSGAYSFSLPVAPPVKTAYAASATTLTFAPESTAAAKYTLEALVPSKPTQTASIDLGTADVVTLFSFAP
ncbi:MAG: DUF4382 domain-containing protein [Burkholderiaceae bacterium]